MPRIPDETVEQVLAATDIVDLIASYGFDLKRQGAVFKTHCPFHNEKTPSFVVNPSHQHYHCFGCSESGSAVGFVMAHENLPFQDALRKLAAKANITIEEGEYDPEEDRRRRKITRLKELHNKAARFMHERLLKDPNAKHARAYLKSRGYGNEMAARWTVGWMPEHPDAFLNWAREAGFTGKELIQAGLAGMRDQGNSSAGLWVRFRDRLMFPIHNDTTEDVIAFSGRQLREDPKSGKYINSPETPIFKKSKVFFGLQKARKKLKGFVLLCEGQLDVIACHEAGVECSVASLGTAFTSDHARLLKRYISKVVICYDSDAAGHKAALRAFPELAGAGIDVRVATMPKGEDPDSLIKSAGPEAFHKLIEHAAEFFDYLLRFTAENENLEDPGTKARVVRELAPLLQALIDKNAQEASINFVATRLGLGVEGIRGAIIQESKRRNLRRNRSVNEEADILVPTPVEREIGVLAALALQSHQVLDFLCDQTEQLLIGTEGREGEVLLRRILTIRPDVPEPAAVNTFLDAQSREDRATLMSLLEDPTPEDPTAAATETLGKLAEQGIVRQMEGLGSRLKAADLSDGEAAEIMREIADLQRIRADSKKT